MYLNNEIERLKEELSQAKNVKEIKEDKDMSDKLVRVIEKLNSFSDSSLDEDVLLTVLKTQNLTKEIYSDGSDN